MPTLPEVLPPEGSFLHDTITNLTRQFDVYLIHGRANQLSGQTNPARLARWDSAFPPQKNDIDFILPVKAHVPRATWEQTYEPTEVPDSPDTEDNLYVRVGIAARQLVVSGRLDYERLCQVSHRLAKLIYPEGRPVERHIMVGNTGSTNEANLAITESPFPVSALGASFGHRLSTNAEIVLVDGQDLPITQLLAIRGYLPNMACFLPQPQSGHLQPINIDWRDVPTPEAIYKYCQKITEYPRWPEVRNAYLTLAIHHSLKSLLQGYLSGGMSAPDEALWTTTIKSRVDYLNNDLVIHHPHFHHLLEPSTDMPRLYRAIGSAALVFQLLSLDDEQTNRIISQTGLISLFFGENNWHSPKIIQVLEAVNSDPDFPQWGELEPEGVIAVIESKKKLITSLANSKYSQAN